MSQTYIGTLEVITCCRCHVAFGMDDAMYNERKRDHRDFYCPVGHPQHFTAKSEAEKLRAQLANEEGRVASLKWELKYTEGRRRAAKGQLTKVKNRIAKGVCPCCNRHFANVQKHMETQHPDYAEVQQSGTVTERAEGST